MPLSNIFKKTSNKLPSSPRSDSLTEGKLFGHPLDEICEDGIPTPLMVSVIAYTRLSFDIFPGQERKLLARLVTVTSSPGWHVSPCVFADLLIYFFTWMMFEETQPLRLNHGIRPKKRNSLAFPIKSSTLFLFWRHRIVNSPAKWFSSNVV